MYRLTLRAIISLSLLTSWMGCEDTPVNLDVPDSVGGEVNKLDVVVTLPTFTVDLVADNQSGNAPLNVTLTANIGGAAHHSELTYAWFKDGNPLEGDERTYVSQFPLNESTDFTVEATFTASNGASRTVTDDITITVIGCADLAWTQVTMESPTDLAPGDTATLAKGTMSNTGDRISTPFKVQAVLSLNEVLDDGDTVVREWIVEQMASGTLGTDVEIDYTGETFQIPEEFAEGNYYVFMVADRGNAVSECAEDDNVSPSTNNITVEYDVALKPDVLVQNITFPQDLQVKQDEFINYQYQIANIGEGESPLYKLAFWLSSDPVLDDDDLKMFGPGDLGSTVSPQGPGSSLNISKSFKIPSGLPDGQYWMIGKADAEDNVLESDEANNIAVSEYPFTMKFEEEQCFDIAFDSLVVAPSATYWGGTVSVSAEVSNPGILAIPEGWPMSVYLSLQPSLNPSSATKLGTFTLPSVPAKSSVVISEIITIPTEIPVIPHYIGVIMDPDSDLSECEEGNNAQLFPEAITVSAQANVDVAISNLQFHPSVAEAGSEIKVSYTLANNGSTGATAFKVGIIFSEDTTLNLNQLNSGTDYLVHELIVNSVPAAGTVTRVEDVVIPLALDHTITQYYVGAIADIDGALGNDTNKSNNTTLGSEIEVTGAMGGCFEDVSEPNNTLSGAADISEGVLTGLGSCGNDDWWKISVPAGYSLLVNMDVSEVLGLDPVPSDLNLQLVGADTVVVDESTNAGNAEDVHVFVVAETGDYYLRVYAAGAGVRAAYDLDVTLLEPVEGIDLLAADVAALPAQLYPGGLLNVSFSDVNLGDTAAPPHWVRVWASADTSLDASDVMVAEQAVEGVAPLSVVSRSVDFQLPVEIGGGTWRFLVETDAEDDIIEAREDNNTGVSDTVFLDAQLTCEDDALEPNNVPDLASPLDISTGTAAIVDAVVCPKLEDWFRVDMAEGQALNVVATYKHDSDKGLLAIELWDPSKTALLLKSASPDTSQFNLPWVWAAGTYYIRVVNQAVGGNQGPYEYDLVVQQGPGAPDKQCDGDVFEDNNSLFTAATIGCGTQDATLCQGDVDAYRIELRANDNLQVTLTHGSSQLKMSLFGDPAAPALASKIGNGVLSYQALADETVLLRVESKNSSALNSYDYTLFMDGVAGVDLTVGTPSLFLPEVYQGEDQLVDFAINNTCVDPSGPFQTTIYLSTDETLDATDVPLESVTVSGVLGKDSVAMSEKVTIPFSTAPGMYHLLVEADTDGEIAESNEDNNTNATAVSVAKLCLPDALEPNDLANQDAPLVAPPGEVGLSLCPFELDWFAVDVVSGQTLTVTAVFSHAEGDLDMRLYDPNYSTTIPVEVAGSKNDNETITVPVSVTGTYYVRVHGFDGGSAEYDLTVAVD